MAFTHGDAALNGDRILIMDDSVQDCLSDSTVITFGPVTVDSIVPFVRIVLSTEDHGTFPAAYLDDFEQVICFWFREWPQEPFIDDQQIKPGISRLDFDLRVQRLCHCEFV